MGECQDKITLKFDGQNHQVELSVFTSVLLDYMAVVKAVSEELDTDVKLLIDATESGSLDAVIAVVNQGFGIFDMIRNDPEMVRALIEIVATVTGIFEVKKQLRASSTITNIDIKGENNVIIVGDKNSVKTTKKIADFFRKRPDATRKINNIFENMADRPEITGFEIVKDKKKIFRAEASEFSSISCSPNFEGEKVQHVKQDVTLKVAKPFLGGSKTRKWEFILNNNKITAPVVDEEFLENVSNGDVSFNSETYMDVILDVEQVWNSEYSAWLNRTYTVVEVSSFYEKQNLTSEKLF